jgi:hypothetical protein
MKGRMMHAVDLEIVIPGLAGQEFGCFGCRILMGRSGLKTSARKNSREYPDEWKEEISILSSWVKELGRLYRHRLNIRIIEAGSPLGLWRQIRHRVFKTPAFIIDRKTTYVGWDLDALQALIDERVLASC